MGLDDDVDLLLRTPVVPERRLLGLEVVDVRGLDFLDDAGRGVSGLAPKYALALLPASRSPSELNWAGCRWGCW